MTPPISNDRGRTADRIASIDPPELHRVVSTAAIDAVRTGVPVERLDSLAYFRLTGVGFGVRDTTQQRRDLLTSQIEQHTRIADQARTNANSTTNPRLRDQFLADAEAAFFELDLLEQQLAELDDDTRTEVLPDQFTAEIDFVAHAIAQLAHTTTTPNRQFGEALERVITDMRVTPRPASRLCDVEFHLLLPADGMVLRCGPIRTTVTNRAYRATLPDDIGVDAPRVVLTGRARAHDLRSRRATTDHEVLQQVKAALVGHGYTDLAAGIIVRSDFGPIYNIAAHDLWGEPLGDFDPAYVELITTTYRNPEFAWNPRNHRLDATMRQQLVDAVSGLGGRAPYPDVIAALAGTKVDDQRITVFSRPQRLGSAPPWEPCVERIGTWAHYAPRTERSLRLRSCPHCGGHASHVVRAPEVPACVLCPTCRRAPTPDSPVHPDDYFAT